MSDFRQYPFRLKWDRGYLDNWYKNVWPQLSDWCTQTYGWGNWEYINNHFRFKTEADKVLFMLRWL